MSVRLCGSGLLQKCREFPALRDRPKYACYRRPGLIPPFHHATFCAREERPHGQPNILRCTPRRHAERRTTTPSSSPRRRVRSPRAGFPRARRSALRSKGFSRQHVPGQVHRHPCPSIHCRPGLQQMSSVWAQPALWRVNSCATLARWRPRDGCRPCGDVAAFLYWSPTLRQDKTTR
jgi:hypothetical protein